METTMRMVRLIFPTPSKTWSFLLFYANPHDAKKWSSIPRKGVGRMEKRKRWKWGGLTYGHRKSNQSINHKTNCGSLNFDQKIYDFCQCEFDLSEVLFPQNGPEQSLPLLNSCCLCPRDHQQQTRPDRGTCWGNLQTTVTFPGQWVYKGDLYKEFHSPKPELLCFFSWKRPPIHGVTVLWFKTASRSIVSQCVIWKGCMLFPKKWAVN